MIIILTTIFSHKDMLGPYLFFNINAPIKEIVLQETAAESRRLLRTVKL